MNNPFTKNLMDRLGPEFNPSNLINKNQKMFQNLSMLNGFAFCGEDDGMMLALVYFSAFKCGSGAGQRLVLALYCEMGGHPERIETMRYDTRCAAAVAEVLCVLYRSVPKLSVSTRSVRGQVSAGKRC